MSSIQSFLRQRNVANSLLQAPVNNCYYTFVAGSGNYVGNYPPGYMVLADASIATAAAVSPGLLIRDMGKTIKAPIGVLANTPILNPAATEGFFREVQLINPVAAVSATGSTTFGVGNGVAGGAAAGTLPSAGNAGSDGYGTFYIPIVIDGTLATSAGTQATIATLPTTYLPLGGQM
jgi:hypothetical protein